MNRLSSLLALMILAAALSLVTVQAAATRKPTSKSAPVLSPEAAQAAGVSSQEISDATKLYTTKCLRCHKSYEPGTYTQAEWDSWMSKMKKKAHLTTVQENALLKYLAACRGTALAGTNRAALVAEPETSTVQSGR